MGYNVTCMGWSWFGVRGLAFDGGGMASWDSLTGILIVCASVGWWLTGVVVGWGLLVCRGAGWLRSWSLARVVLARWAEPESSKVLQPYHIYSLRDPKYCSCNNFRA